MTAPLRFREFRHQLAAALREELPGVEAHLTVAPRPRPGRIPGHLPADARAAAALLLVFPVDDVAHLVLTVRSSDLPKHAGQVSLPGGAVDPGETIEAAALREAREEIGLDAAAVSVLGTLTPLYIRVSGFTLYPVVGICDSTPTLRPEPAEVHRVLQVPVEHLLDAERVRMRRALRDGVEMEVPYFHLDSEEVWGATAMVLAEFRALVQRDVE